MTLEEKEFSIDGMLDNKREAAEKLGFYEDVRPGLLKKMIMSTYRKEFVKKYYLSSLTWSPQEERHILKWTRRMESMELTEEQYQEEFKGFFENK